MKAWKLNGFGLEHLKVADSDRPTTGISESALIGNHTHMTDAALGITLELRFLHGRVFMRV
jgi:hypothetical protein